MVGEEAAAAARGVLVGAVMGLWWGCDGGVKIG